MFGILRPRKHVKAWIFGHTHQWNVSQDESGIHLINLPPCAYLFTPGHPNGWVHATLKPDGITTRTPLMSIRRTKDHEARVKDPDLARLSR